LPSVFAISLVFGGGLGMTAAAAFGLDAGGGFVVGAASVFMLLSIAVLQAREFERELRILLQRFPEAGRDIDPMRR
jgi:hypothetical protein